MSNAYLFAPAGFAGTEVIGRSGNVYTVNALGVLVVPLGPDGTGQSDIGPLVSAGFFPLDSAGDQLLGYIIGANMNETTDQPFTLLGLPGVMPFRVTKITAKNGSVSLTTAAGGVYTAAAKGGTAIVANSQAYTGVTGPTLAEDLTIATTPGKTVNPAATPLFLSLTTPQGAAATCDFYAYGDVYVFG